MTIRELINKYEHNMYNRHNNFISLDDVVKDLVELEKEYKRTHILLVEDGSVDDCDTKAMEELGYKVITYRKGANMPEIIGK